ncbi:MAG: hypothetical protein N3E47_01970 [Candidatus Bathyarchaeota archaeon]|nr:hypothetical protein [Candidatus Bathyarchaeota archaeon]
MEPLNIIYWVKVALGALAGALCVILRINNIFSGVMLCMAVYLVSDKILRQIFIAKVSKPSDVTKTGIGIYIASWVFFWVLLYTIIYPH